MLPEARGLEFLIIAAIALIVVGPKELPNLLRKLGQFVGKMRRVADDFRSSFDEMAKQSELDDLRQQVEQMRSQATSATSDPLGMNAAMGDFNAGLDPAFNHGTIPEEYTAPPVPEAAKPARKRAAPKATAVPAKAATKTAAPKSSSPKLTTVKKATPPKAPVKPAAKPAPKKTPTKTRAAPKIVT